MTISCAKTAEPIEMPFGVRTRVGILCGSPDPQGKVLSTFNHVNFGEACPFSTEKYREWYCMVNGMVNVDLHSGIITKVSNAPNTPVSGEKPGSQALSKGLIVLAKVIR